MKRRSKGKTSSAVFSLRPFIVAMEGRRQTMGTELAEMMLLEIKVMNTSPEGGRTALVFPLFSKHYIY